MEKKKVVKPFQYQIQLLTRTHSAFLATNSTTSPATCCNDRPGHVNSLTLPPNLCKPAQRNKKNNRKFHFAQQASEPASQPASQSTLQNTARGRKTYRGESVAREGRSDREAPTLTLHIDPSSSLSPPAPLLILLEPPPPASYGYSVLLAI
ncbi:hypothetical protein E2C01_084499 [Portunus trituberculatus]|uniref:Uncharacterized protein n=1 Tax=Portunus trituberculatus TaxID=210409 RepID=A0A5B7J6G2_PORTR|nr:hypothetical protein [Portunus trituberculatus]